MKGLIILVLDNNRNNVDNKTFIYDDIINLLIKGQKIKNQYPKIDIYCLLLKDDIINDDIHRILASFFDKIILVEKKMTN